MEQIKQCSKCGESKMLYLFSPDPRYSMGVKGQCRLCTASYKRSRRAKNPDVAQRDRDEAMRYYKSIQGTEKGNKAKTRKSEYDKQRRIECFEKLREYERTKRQRDPEATKAIKKSYKHRRRSIEARGMSGPELKVWTEKQVKRCYWCGTDCEDSFHVDHYQPLARGGEHKPENLVIACPPCNLMKNAKDPKEFAKQVERHRIDVSMLGVSDGVKQ